VQTRAWCAKPCGPSAAARRAGREPAHLGALPGLLLRNRQCGRAPVAESLGSSAPDPAGSGAHRTTVVRLGSIWSGDQRAGRASIIWLVGEFAGRIARTTSLPTCCAFWSGFSDEAEAAKLQIVLLPRKYMWHYLNANPPPDPVPQTSQSKDAARCYLGFEEEGGSGTRG